MSGRNGLAGLSERWRQFFAQVARAAQSMSRDPSTQVGAVIFDADRQIVATGFNGVPRGVEDGDPPKLPEEINTPPDPAYVRRVIRPGKYLWMEHAERNAVFQGARRGVSLLGSSMMVTHRPCADCMRAVIQGGVQTVYILEGEMGSVEWSESQDAAAAMAEEAGVTIILTGPDGEVL